MSLEKNNNKKILREKSLQQRLVFSLTQDYNTRSEKINKKIHFFFKTYLINNKNDHKIVSLYYPIKGEVNILPLYSEIIHSNPNLKLCIPKIFKNDIKFFIPENFLDLEKNKFGIYEPKKFSKEVYPDIMLVPGLCFNENNLYRLGYGKGYFDKYFKKLKEMNHDFINIGVYFSFQSETFEIEEHDIPHDIIITEKYTLFKNINTKLKNE